MESVESREWRVESGEWGVESGEWSGEWRLIINHNRRRVSGPKAVGVFSLLCHCSPLLPSQSPLVEPSDQPSAHEIIASANSSKASSWLRHHRDIWARFLSGERGALFAV